MIGDGDWWARELAEARADWDQVKDQAHSGETDCDVCMAGDGDPRCVRCGCSVGMPGCQCTEGPEFGPCLQRTL